MRGLNSNTMMYAPILRVTFDHNQGVTYVIDSCVHSADIIPHTRHAMRPRPLAATRHISATLANSSSFRHQTYNRLDVKFNAIFSAFISLPKIMRSLKNFRLQRFSMRTGCAHCARAPRSWSVIPNTGGVFTRSHGRVRITYILCERFGLVSAQTHPCQLSHTLLTHTLTNKRTSRAAYVCLYVFCAGFGDYKDKVRDGSFNGRTSARPDRGQRTFELNTKLLLPWSSKTFELFGGRTRAYDL